MSTLIMLDSLLSSGHCVLYRRVRGFQHMLLLAVSYTDNCRVGVESLVR